MTYRILIISTLLALHIPAHSQQSPQTAEVAPPTSEISQETAIIREDINKISITTDDTVLWNGTKVSLEQMSEYLEKTKAMSPEPKLQFQPSHTSSYETVNAILLRIKESDVEKWGFFGNEKEQTSAINDEQPSTEHSI